MEDTLHRDLVDDATVAMLTTQAANFGGPVEELAARRDEAAGATVMEWEAEPFAVAFYETMGGRRVRDSEPSPIWNRTIPGMALTLE